jgi:squalene synthase HpnC
VAVGHYENFPVASLLMPRELRDPVKIIYRFARSADDFADEGADPPDVRLAKLDGYRRELRSPSQPLFHDIQKIVREHELPLQLFVDLLDAFSQDVIKKRYASFAEVLDYCRRSANPVGRLLLHLFKRTTDSDLRRSDSICSALQLVNFWQDVEVDWRKDRRVYLPQDEMARYGVTEAHLAEHKCDDMARPPRVPGRARAQDAPRRRPARPLPPRPRRARDPRHRARRPAHPREDRGGRLRRVREETGADALRLARAPFQSTMKKRTMMGKPGSDPGFPR